MDGLCTVAFFIDHYLISTIPKVQQSKVDSQKYNISHFYNLTKAGGSACQADDMQTEYFVFFFFCFLSFVGVFFFFQNNLFVQTSGSHGLVFVTERDNRHTGNNNNNMNKTSSNEKW